MPWGKVKEAESEAKNANMFGLLESCILNKVNFGEYIEDVLTRILFGEEGDESFLPCDYVRRYEDGKDAELPQHAA